MNDEIQEQEQEQEQEAQDIMAMMKSKIAKMRG
jgi:hypothetical protein